MSFLSMFKNKEQNPKTGLTKQQQQKRAQEYNKAQQEIRAKYAKTTPTQTQIATPNNTVNKAPQNNNTQSKNQK